MSNCFVSKNIWYCSDSSSSSSLIVGRDNDNPRNAVDNVDIFQESLTIPKFVKWKRITKIGKNSFCQLTNLKKVYIAARITEIAFRSFDQCKNLEYINIPSSVEKIGGNALCLSDNGNGVSSGTTTIVFEPGSKLQLIGEGGISSKQYFSITFCGTQTFNNCESQVFKFSEKITIYSPSDIDFCPDSTQTITNTRVPKENLCPPLIPHQTLPCSGCFQKRINFSLHFSFFLLL